MLLWTGGSEDLFGPVLNFFHSMATLLVTEAEYALLTATALLCSGQTSNKAQIRKQLSIEDKCSVLLYSYMWTQPNGPRFCVCVSTVPQTARPCRPPAALRKCKNWSWTCCPGCAGPRPEPPAGGRSGSVACWADWRSYGPSVTTTSSWRDGSRDTDREDAASCLVRGTRRSGGSADEFLAHDGTEMCLFGPNIRYRSLFFITVVKSLTFTISITFHNAEYCWNKK